MNTVDVIEDISANIKERFQVLPLVRQFLTSYLLVSEEEQNQIRERWLQYLLILTENNKNYSPQNYANINPEIGNIKSAVNWCWEQQSRLLIDFVNNIAYYLHAEGHWNHLEKYLQWGIEISTFYQSEKPQARFYYLKGIIRQYRGDLETATKFINRAISISKATNQPYRWALSLTRIGLIERRKKRYELAKQYCMESMALANQLDSESLRIRNRLSLSIIAIAQEDFQTAQDLLAQCNALNDQTNWQSAWWYRQRGQVAMFNGEYAEAEWLLQRSLNIVVEATPMQQNVGEALFCQAWLALSLGKYDQALDKAKEALTSFEYLNMIPQVPDTQHLIEIISQAKAEGTRPTVKAHL